MVSKKRSRADEEEEPAAAAAEVALAAIPKRKSAESQVALILQALQNGDTGMLGDALQADAATVTSTVARLPTSSVLPFLEAVLYHMQGKPARVASLASWIRALLAQHADLLACPSLQPKLAPLYELIDERLAAFKPLLKLVGRMQMLQSQLVAQQTATQQEGGAPSDPVLTFDEVAEEEEAARVEDGQEGGDDDDDDEAAEEDGEESDDDDDADDDERDSDDDGGD